MSRDCCVALLRGDMIFLQFVIVVFPDHTHYFYTMETKTGSLTSTILKYAFKLGRWTYQDRVLYLAGCLRRKAQVYYMTLMPTERSSYNTLSYKIKSTLL